jgi:hypothetical protein
MERRYLIPEWQGSVFQKWAKNFSYRNAWRVQNILGDYDDCLAKCAHDFVVCRIRYGATVNSDKHMMFCYTQWVVGEFNTLAVLDGKERQMHTSLPTHEECVFNEGELGLKLQSASSELQSVIKILLEAPQEIMQIIRKDASSCHPKQAFKSAAKIAGVQVGKVSGLMRELQTLLSK